MGWSSFREDLIDRATEAEHLLSELNDICSDNQYSLIASKVDKAKINIDIIIRTLGELEEFFTDPDNANVFKRWDENREMLDAKKTVKDRDGSLADRDRKIKELRSIIMDLESKNKGQVKEIRECKKDRNKLNSTLNNIYHKYPEIGYDMYQK